MQLYIAGPLFTPYHRALHSANVQKLREAGHECFVPQEKERKTRQRKNQPAVIFSLDLDALKWANAIIAVLDDADISSGTATEIGIFYELARHDPEKMGILGILTDDRSTRRERSNGGQSINFFTLGCIYKMGRVYPSIGPVLDHLAEWQRELEKMREPD